MNKVFINVKIEKNNLIIHFHKKYVICNLKIYFEKPHLNFL